MKRLAVFLMSGLMALCSCEELGFDADRGLFLEDAAKHRYGVAADGMTPLERTAILHVSDIHCGFDRLQVILRLAVDNAQLMVNTGDDAKGLPGDDFAVLSPCFELYRKLVNSYDVPVLGAQGNHDAQCTKAEYYMSMVAPMRQSIPGLVIGDTDNFRTYGYLDLGEGDSALRIIVLDPRDGVEDTMDWWHVAFSQRQIDWLIKTLDDARSRNIGVLTMMHYGFGDNPKWDHENLRPDITFLQNPFMIPDIIDAMQRGCELTRTYAPRGEGAETVNVDVQESAERLDYIAHLFGHLHSKEAFRCARSDGSKDYDMLMLGEASLTNKGGKMDNTDRRQGSPNDIAASLLYVDRREEAIYRVSYGSYLTSDGRHSERTEKLPYRFRSWK